MNGKLRLVAVEWAATFNNVGPSVFGQPYVGSETHGLAPRFELHARVWKHNPSGTVRAVESRVRCS